ncbi:IclR family transcriptional regulator [Corynebacterium breve]|uniref:IclR family transcriptional regulator n=1 Tax=Corynebacterium breve TaxID=3049799 RepID=A0ABY8VCG8_9CORY|nr:IclR family transcriptional regulator [Corynebacterium breve]WIM67183.1 IclR family transcriptional regulator [Corynebacterium breve]
MTTSPHVQSLSRGLAVIRTFDRQHPRQTLAQVAEATGLARATARRFLHTLVAEGYADTDGSEFWLTPSVLELGYAYMSSLGLPAIAQPHLEKLSRTIDESCSLSLLDGHDVVYVGRVPVRKIMTVNITIGTRFPAHAASMGRVLLAYLPPAELDEYFATSRRKALTPRTIVDEVELRAVFEQIRKDGWAVVDQELEPGLRSLAAPVFNGDNEVVAAVNISTQAAVHEQDELFDTFLPELLATCRAISNDIATTHQS